MDGDQRTWGDRTSCWKSFNCSPCSGREESQSSLPPPAGLRGTRRDAREPLPGRPLPDSARLPLPTHPRPPKSLRGQGAGWGGALGLVLDARPPAGACQVPPCRPPELGGTFRSSKQSGRAWRATLTSRVSPSALSTHPRHSPSVTGLTSLRHRVGDTWLHMSHPESAVLCQTSDTFS